MPRALLLIAIALLVACGGEPAAPPSTASARRIVSLSPALSASLVDLGWGDRIVGRTPWCAGLEGVPVVGSLLEVDLERLAAARPDLVLAQRSASGPPPGLVEAASARGWRVAAVPCTSMSEVVELGSAVEAAVGEPSPRGDGREAWRRALAPLPAAEHASPAVILFGTDPPMAFGRDAYLAEAWRSWGGTALPDAPGHPSLSLEDLSALRPRTVYLAGAAPSSPDLARACAERGIALVALEDERLLRPGPAVREALEAWRRRLEGRAP
jgi:iron complex transport system substrate-binding protein